MGQYTYFFKFFPNHKKKIIFALPFFRPSHPKHQCKDDWVRKNIYFTVNINMSNIKFD